MMRGAYGGFMIHGKIHPGGGDGVRWGYGIRDEDGGRAEEVRRKEKKKMGL